MTKHISLQFRQLNAHLLKTEIQRLLFTSVGFSLLLLLARTVYTGRLTFVFLVWNLFLAFVPWFISYTLTLLPAMVNRKWKFFLAFTVWLLFVPNSFYMITDLFHLFDSGRVPYWYDLMLLFCFVWNALLMGILSVRHMEKIVQTRWRYQSDWLFVYPIMLLNAFGIYIGRFMRYNTWDIVSNPFRLLLQIINVLLHPFTNQGAWGHDNRIFFFPQHFLYDAERVEQIISIAN